MPSRGQIRIRVELPMLRDLVDILERERARLLCARAEMRDFQVAGGETVYNRLLNDLKLLQGEVDRTIAEQESLSRD